VWQTDNCGAFVSSGVQLLDILMMEKRLRLREWQQMGQEMLTQCCMGLLVVWHLAWAIGG